MKIEQKENQDHFWSGEKPCGFFSNEQSSFLLPTETPLSVTSNPKLHSDIALLLSTSRFKRLFLVVVVMLETRVVEVGIIVTLVADRRKSFTGATMIKY